MKKIITLLLVVFLVSLFVSCTKTYTKQGGSSSQFEKDDFDCRQASKTIAGGGGSGAMGVGMIVGAIVGGQIQANKTYEDCMRVKGYTEQGAEEKPDESVHQVRKMEKDMRLSFWDGIENKEWICNSDVKIVGRCKKEHKKYLCIENDDYNNPDPFVKEKTYSYNECKVRKTLK